MTLRKWFEKCQREAGATISVFENKGISWKEIRLDRLSKNDGRVLLLIDAEQSPPSIWDVIELVQALNSYDKQNRIGVVHPAYVSEGSVISGIAFKRETMDWVPMSNGHEHFHQSLIPRYTLAAQMHSAVVSPQFLAEVFQPESTVGCIEVDAFSEIVRMGWELGFRCLSFPQVRVQLRNFELPSDSSSAKQWLGSRRVTGVDGRTRIIFVLPATTLSGGIRVIFEKAGGLLRRGFDVEIWSLESENAWNEIDIPIRRFPTFQTLGIALGQEQAIKVATWWETADFVFLASVKRGIPVQFVQEFETWFYPNSPLYQAAVVASYRPEFEYLTTADFQKNELNQIGVDATLVPVGFDSSIYRELTTDIREPNTVVAIGRTFYQKNFAMTLEAWKTIQAPKPKLIVFSSERMNFREQNLEFISKPNNEQVNQIYNRGSIFVQTSRHEGFCLPILEAMAAGCVIITTDSHGNRGFCHDGYNCIVVRQGDVNGLGTTIEKLLKDDQTMDKLRKNALKTASQYAWPVILDEYALAYQKVANKG